jgi:hypothetical protein
LQRIHALSQAETAEEAAAHGPSTVPTKRKAAPNKAVPRRSRKEQKGDAVASLVEFGFPENKCAMRIIDAWRSLWYARRAKEALAEAGGDVAAATEWLLANLS